MGNSNNGNLADEGRAGTISPTHPHNEPSLDRHEGTTRKKRVKNKNEVKGKRQVKKGGGEK